MEVDGRRQAMADLPPGKKPVTHRTGGCVGPRVGLEGYMKTRPHRDSINGQPSP
jgi:hypothetical protein